MKLHIVSDLHFEHDPQWRLPRAEADVLVLAGDIAPGLRGLGAFFKYGKPVIYVPGNHEYYGENMPGLAAAMRLYAKTCGITILDKDEAVIGGVRFLGTTLWTDFHLFGADRAREALAYADKHLNDYITIRNGKGGWFTAAQSGELHRTSAAWLERKLSEPFAGPTVVVTHHAPHPNSVNKRFGGHLLNCAFVSDLSRMMGTADLWIHGHTHDSFDYTVGSTRVLANPKGYRDENKAFVPDLVLDLDAVAAAQPAQAARIEPQPRA
jgi:predicted phosphodiesterase